MSHPDQYPGPGVPPTPGESPFYPPGVAAVPSPPAPPPQYYPEPPSYLPPGYVAPEYGGSAPGGPRRSGLMVAAIVVVVVIGLAAVVGIGFFAYSVARNLTATTPAPTGTVGPFGSPTTPAPGPTTTSAPRPFVGDLRSLLTPAPNGSKAWSDFPDEPGTLTLAQAADLFTNKTQMSDDLHEFHFERGAVVRWNQNNTFVMILLFQFDSTTDALEFVADTKRVGLKDFEARGEFGSIDGSLLYVNDKPNSQGQRTTIFVSSHRELMAYTTIWHPGPINLAAATATATAQHNRLP
jgi:hypothetical protein